MTSGYHNIIAYAPEEQRAGSKQGLMKTAENILDHQRMTNQAREEDIGETPNNPITFINEVG